MKLVLIGAGSFVFAPSVIEDVLAVSRLEDFEFVFFDISAGSADLMARVAKAVAGKLNLKLEIRSTADRADALKGADYVIASVAVEGKKRWQIDYDICRDEGIAHLARENGSVGGLMYGLRGATLILSIARDMETYCPRALLLNVSNPLTRLQTAVHRYTGIEAYGFCNVALCGPDGYDRIARLTGRRADEIDAVTAGLNHFSWIVSAADKGGVDLMPDLMAGLERAAKDDAEFEAVANWYRQFRMIAAPPADHQRDFIPTQPDTHYGDHPPFHGSQAERKRAAEQLEAVADGRLDYEKAERFQNRSWEHPGLVAAALYTKSEYTLPMINLPNAGNLPQLPQGNIVEVPAMVKDGRLIGRKDIALHERVIEVLAQQSEVAEMVARAAAEGNRALVSEIVEFDGSIDNKFAARRAVSRMLEAHSDVLPQLG